MSAREMESMNAFLQHRSNDGGNKLGNWKEKKKVNTFLHTKILPIALWRHGWQKLVVRDDGVQVWGDSLNCHEDEKVLKRQYKRNDDGSRVAPPCACPQCRLLEAVHELVDDKKLKWTQPIFRFNADDSEKSVVIHAGGFLGEFQGELDDDEKELCKKAGISLFEAWKENGMAKMSYVFYVVDADNVEKGLQMAVETSLLGDKVKDVINDTYESLGPEAGDPMKHPYCIQWVYNDEKKLPINKRYTARRLERVAMTPEIEEIIRGPRPDFSQEVRPFSANELRASIEKAASPELLKLLNWDAIFAPPQRGATDVGARHPDLDDEAPATPAKPAPAAPPPADVDETVACDTCGKEIKLSWPKCPHCGHEYEVTPAAPPPPPPPSPPRRSRSAARKGAQAAPAPAPAPAAAQDDGDAGEAATEDEIPF